MPEMDEGDGDDSPGAGTLPAHAPTEAQNNNNAHPLKSHNSNTHNIHDSNMGDTVDDASGSSQVPHKTTPFRFKSTKKRHSSDEFDKDLRPHRSSHKHRRRSRDDSPHRRSHHRHHRDDSSSRHRKRRHKHSHSTSNATSNTNTSNEPKPPQEREQAHPAPRLTDDNYNQDIPEMDADTAFRESLFDALADDEGADYWSAIYGQPIHTFSRTKRSTNPANGETTLEEMSEDEYVTYVRRKMWERSAEGMEEARKQKAKQKQEEQRQREQQDARRRTRGRRSAFDSSYDPEGMKQKNGQFGYLFDFDELIDDALKRGKERKQDRRRRDAWTQYTNAWEKLINPRPPTTLKEEHATGENGNHNTPVDTDPRNASRDSPPTIPWPTTSGKPADISKQSLKQFFEAATTIPLPPKPNASDSNTTTTTKSRVRVGRAAEEAEEETYESLKTILKRERVRWHPDKVQQRLGPALDSETIRQITAVFQIVDALYEESRP